MPGGPDFSISHCEGRVACAVSAGSTVGLDIELESRAGGRAWLQRWTATEAVLKAAGIGLRSAADVRIDASAATIDGLPSRYVLVPLALADGLVACLACSRDPDPLVVVEISDLL
jgi:phosphopantetheinyl transferase